MDTKPVQLVKPRRTVAISPESYFDGSPVGMLGKGLLAALLSVVTLGIGYPWAKCMFVRWCTGHTVINGQRLSFTGRGSGLFLKWLIWTALTVVTLGAYGFAAAAEFEKWKAENTTSRSENVSKPRMKNNKILFIIVPVLMLAEIAAIVALYNLSLIYFEQIPDIPLIKLYKAK